jgi:hypothetical protein
MKKMMFFSAAGVWPPKTSAAAATRLAAEQSTRPGRFRDQSRDASKKWSEIMRRIPGGTQKWRMSKKGGLRMIVNQSRGRREIAETKSSILAIEVIVPK